MIIGISGKIGSGKDTIGKIVQYLVSKSKGSYVKFTDTFDSEWQIKKFGGKLKDIVCLLINCTREQLEDSDFKEKELGEEWRVYYIQGVDDKRKINKSWKRISPIFVSKEELDEYFVNNRSMQDFMFLDVTHEARRVSEILTPRKLLQLIGTDCGRQIISPNIWVNALMNNYKPFNKGDYIEHTESAIRGEDGLRYTKDKKVQINTDKYVWYEKVRREVYPDWIITDIRFENEVKAVKDKGGVVIRVNRNMQKHRTCLDCYTFFNFDEAYYPNPSDKNVYVCPNCKSIRHAAVLVEQDQHESETALDNYKDFDFEINNDRDIEGLIGQVKAILHTLKIV